MMPGYLLDTSAINHVLDRGIDPWRLGRLGSIFVTHVQADEIRRTRKPDRRAALLSVLQEIQPARVSTSIGVFGHSSWDEALWETGESSDMYRKLVVALDARNRRKPNNIEDALIGVTAIVQHHTLVSDDGDLAAVVRELCGEAISLDDLLQRVVPR